MQATTTTTKLVNGQPTARHCQPQHVHTHAALLTASGCGYCWKLGLHQQCQ